MYSSSTTSSGWPRSLRVGLEAEGFAVDVAHDGTDGLWLARENAYDVIVLDLMLPGINGYKVCETLRAEKNWTPILMLTAKDGEWDQVEGLDTGADDYLTKPFSFPVLVARLRAVARRGARERPTLLEAGDLRLDPAARRRLARRRRARADGAGVLAAGRSWRATRATSSPSARSSRRSGTSTSRATPTSSRSTSATCATRSTGRSGARRSRPCAARATGWGATVAEGRLGRRLGPRPHDGRGRAGRGGRPGGRRLRAGRPGAGLAARRARDQCRASGPRRSPTRSTASGLPGRAARRGPATTTTTDDPEDEVWQVTDADGHRRARLAAAEPTAAHRGLRRASSCRAPTTTTSS